MMRRLPNAPSGPSTARCREGMYLKSSPVTFVAAFKRRSCGGVAVRCCWFRGGTQGFHERSRPCGGGGRFLGGQFTVGVDRLSAHPVELVALGPRRRIGRRWRERRR